MVITHNMKAANAERQLNVVTADKAKSTEKLSSGYQINRSGDNAAGLSISEKMRHQIRGLNRGSSNIEEGVGYCQVADGALNEMHDMLQRMNELCVQAANGTLSDSDRGHIDDEVQQLKIELQRICDTTKFNEEYIFRCEDVMPEESHDVYKLSFSGTPKDLFVYESNAYDKYDDGQPYAGICYRGRRYTWEEINPRMYDPATKTFRKGEYSIRSDADDTVLTLICEDGAKLPEVSRKYTTSADGRGIYVNDDFAVSWDVLERTKVGNKYSFQYHGVQISFTAEDDDSFEDKVLKMTGTIWESTYVTPVDSKALDAYFTPYTYKFNGKGTTNEDTNERIKTHVQNKNKTTKYILHAEDINNNGTIPVNGEYIPFDGVWIEETNTNWTGTGRALWKMTWGEFKELTEVLQNKLDTIPGTSNFGFTCDKDSAKHDWSDLSTDIWAGNDRTEDPSPYPPDEKNPGSDLNHGGTVGNKYFANYDPYNTFSFSNPEDNNENVRFIFSVINEISKTEAVKALDGVEIGYTNFQVYNKGMMDNNYKSDKVGSQSVSVKLTLDGEYYLGRDYENGQSAYELKSAADLNYVNGGGFSIEYAYDSGRMGGNLRYTMSNGAVENLISNKANILTRYVFTNRNQNMANIQLSTDFQLSLSPSSSQMSSTMTLNYNNYNLSGFGTPQLHYPPNNSGSYIRRKDGTYEEYNRYSSAQKAELDRGEAQRCDIYLTNTNGVRIEDYLRNTVMPDIAKTTKVSLQVNDYPSAVLGADENENSVGVTRWQTPFQHPHVIPPEEPPEKPEYLRIQCSSNVEDAIWIQKQKLSVYRLGLTNVGLLSEAQATGCIDTVGKALAKISSIRSLFGAEQNRLEHAYDINRNTHENTQHAESKIRDTDMAKEMIKYSNANILEQSGNSILVQANQANNIVLSLLK